VLSLETVNNLIDDMVESRKINLEKKIKIYPRDRFRASDIPECDRQLFYGVNNWQDRIKYDISVQSLFDAGNEAEKTVKKRLADDGFEVIEQQRDFEIKNRDGEIICRGHIDGKIEYNGQVIPIEIKSMNQNIYNGIKSLQDFGKKPYLRKYLRQMQLYLYGNNAEAGIFILTDFRTHKLLPVVLDMGECEAILKQLERTWEAVKEKKVPEKIEYKESICGKCSFAHICLPDVKNEGAKFINNEELENTLERREVLKQSVHEYKELDDLVKNTFKNIPVAFVGSNFHIVGKEIKTNRIDTKVLPEDIKKEYSKESTYWKTKVINLTRKLGGIN
jgi:CRISPR/Cas system-associated exonuclease Cas4 (RecB family)